MNQLNQLRKWVVVLILSAGAGLLALCWVLSKSPKSGDEGASSDTNSSQSSELSAGGRGNAPQPVPQSAKSNLPAQPFGPDSLPPPSPLSQEAEARMLSDLKAKRVSALSQLYQGYFRTAAIPQTQQEKVVALLADAEVRLFESMKGDPATGARPVPPSPEFIYQQEMNLNRQLQETLGQENFAELQSYRRSIPDRILVQQLERESLQTPLSEEQSRQLVQIMQQEREKVFSQQPAVNLDGLGRDQARTLADMSMQQINQAVSRRAAEILMPDQLEILLRVQEHFHKK